jgi:hypothetical protein
MALIQVIQDMIDAGTRCDPFNCALAIGIKSHLREGASVSVRDDFIEFLKRDANSPWCVHCLFPTPPDCQRFMYEFDSGRAEPFTTRIPIPLSLLRGPIT